MSREAVIRSQILLDDKPFQKGADRVSKRSKSLQREVTAHQQKMSSGFQNLGRTMVGVFAAGGIARMFSRSKDRLEEVNKTARQLGETMEGVQRLRFLAEQNTSDLRTVSDGLIRMNRRLAETGEMGKKARSIIEGMGMDVEQFINLRPEEQLYRLVDGLRSVEGQGQKLAQAFKLMDQGGRAVVAMSTNTSDELRDLAGSLNVVSNEAAADFIIAMDKTAAVAEKVTMFLDQLSVGVGYMIQGWEKAAAVAGWAYAAVTVGVDEANAAMREFDQANARQREQVRAGAKSNRALAESIDAVTDAQKRREIQSGRSALEIALGAQQEGWRLAPSFTMENHASDRIDKEQLSELQKQTQLMQKQTGNSDIGY